MSITFINDLQRPPFAALAGKIAYWHIALAIALYCCIGAVIDFSLNPELVFPFDDSYITLHNVRTLLSGADSNFPLSPALSGATSALHLLLVAAFSLALPSIEAGSFAVGWLTFAGYLALLLLLARERGLTPVKSLALVLLAAIIGKTTYQMLNGLETGTAMMAVVASVYSLEFRTMRSRFISGILLGLLPAIRPELAVLSLLLVASTLLDAFNRRDEAVAQSKAGIIALLSGGFLGLAPWIVWYYMSTGDPIPLTISAKTAFFSEACAPAAEKSRYVLNAAANFIGEIGIAVALVAGLLSRRRSWAIAAFIVIFLAAYYLRFPGALGHYWYRYWYPLIPAIFFGAMEMMSARRRYIRLSAYALITISLLFSLAKLPDNMAQTFRDREATTRDHGSLASWINQNLSGDDRLLVHDVGHISWNTDLPLVDLVGLKTPESIQFHKEITYPSCGKQRALAISKIGIKFSATHLVVLDGWDKIFGITSGLREEGWGLQKIRSGRYSVYHLTKPSSAPS
jgi:hypothetical protein